VKRRTLQFHREGRGSNWLSECGICPVFTGCPEHPPSGTSAAAQLQKETGKILETSFQLIFCLEVDLLFLKKQLLVEGETALITESQNHRMVGVGRDLCGSSSPTPLQKQVHLEQAAQDLVQVGLEYLQRRRIHNLPGQPCMFYPVCLIFYKTI